MRNEASRFLREAVSIWTSFSDEVICLDDASTDNSREVASGAGAHVRRRFHRGSGCWGQESPARRDLWNLVWNAADEGDYILFLDADMIPARDPRPLMDVGADSIFFPLYDLWNMSPLTYREDGFWQGHLYPRLWMVRKRSGMLEWEWSPRGVHCGHMPLNLPAGRLAFAPQDFALLHHAYATPSLRALKHSAYLSIAAQLSDAERAHAASIIDANPATFNLPFAPCYALSLPTPSSEA